MTGTLTRRSVLTGGLAGSLALAAAPAASAAGRDPSGDDRRLRVMTWNIHHAVAPDAPDVTDLERIAAVIRSEAADLVLLNEVHRDPEGPGSHGDQPAQLAALLHTDGYSSCEYGLAETDLPHGDGILPGSTVGNVVMSKYPIVGGPRIVKLPNENYEPGGKDRRSLLSVTVDMPHVGRVDVHVTHLSTPGSAVLVEDQKEQVQIVLDHVDTSRPAVLCGDLNIRVTDVAEQDFSQNNLMQSWIALDGLADTWRQVNNSGDGPTMSGSYGKPQYPHPDRRIDYVYASPHMEVEAGHVSVIDQFASDHLAVVMDLRVGGARGPAGSRTVLAGEEGLDGWAQVTTTRSGEVRLSVCKNRNTTEDDGTTVRATIRTPSGRIVRTVTDGGTSRDRCTVESWSDRLPPPSTLEVCLVQGEDVLHRRVERLDR